MNQLIAVRQLANPLLDFFILRSLNLRFVLDEKNKWQLTLRSAAIFEELKRKTASEIKFDASVEEPWQTRPRSVGMSRSYILFVKQITNSAK